MYFDGMAQHSGYNAGLSQCSFRILHQTSSWLCDHFVDKASTVSQPAWTTQPAIPPGSVNAVRCLAYSGKQQQKAWREVARMSLSASTAKLECRFAVGLKPSE